MAKVINKDELLSNAYSPLNRKAREIVLAVIENILDSIDPKKMVRSKVVLTDDTLRVNEKYFDLTTFERIFLIGGGKASGSMAEALEEILGERIEDSLVVIPRGTKDRYRVKRIKFHEASHPIPDESSVEGARKLLDLASHAEEKDLVICLISGGGSSLMALPRDGITLSDKQKITDLLLKSGATINEINAVRKHISIFKGGYLAKKAYPATLLSLLLSDVLGDPLDVIASGPTVPDSTTFCDAVYVLKKYNLWEKIPESIRKILSDGVNGLIQEPPKKDDPAFRRVHNVIIGNNRLACQAAIDKLKELGLNTLFLTSFIEGESRDVGLMLGAIAKEILTSGNPLPPPAGLVVGGETTVTVVGDGVGGRNQEICLSAASKIENLDRVLVASVSTDGIDGPTDAAGAVVDGKTIFRSRKLRLDANEYLKNNNSYSFFSQIGDLIRTGATGSNVNDITILIIL